MLVLYNRCSFPREVRILASRLTSKSMTAGVVIHFNATVQYVTKLASPSASIPLNLSNLIKLPPQIFNTSSSTPPLQHLLFNTSSSTPPLQHLLFNTSSSTPPLQHLLFNTSSSTPPLQHLLFNTSSSTPPLQHLLFNTSSSTPPTTPT